MFLFFFSHFFFVLTYLCARFNSEEEFYLYLEPSTHNQTQHTNRTQINQATA